ncbi:MAG: RimJ/RimL family protein N-acetyltransferase [Bacteroidetes bacterium]|nr:MAG: RimJ/RimL family protein N-acetyltransferase [Bacteroidota bacterium]
MKVLQTQRLQLHRITEADAAFYVKLFNSESWLQYIGDRNVHTIADAEAYIRKNYLSSYKKHGYGSYTVRLEETGETIGACGLYKRDDLDHPDIGFAFLTQHLGKGYGYEAASAVMEYARNKLGIKTLLGFTVEDNIASVKLLEKLGLKQKGTYTFKDAPVELLLFSN